MAGNGGGTAAVQPEGFACLGGDGDEAFAVAGVGVAHHLAGGLGHRVFGIRYDVGNQHHFRAATAFGLGGVAHGAHIAPVQVLQAG